MGIKDFEKSYVGNRQIIAVYRGETQVYGADAEQTVPDAFDAADWYAETGTGAGKVVLTITDLPYAGGSPITALQLQYTVDGGDTWTALAGADTGVRTLTMPALSTAYIIALRAANAIGTGAASTGKSATSGAAPLVMTWTTEPVANRVYQRTTTTGGAYSKGTASVSFAVTLSEASPIYARVRDAETDEIIVAATQITASGIDGSNAGALAVPARTGWNKLDVAPSASGPWTQGVNRFGIGRVILGIGQSQIGRFAAKAAGGETIASLVPAASPYATVRSVYTGGGGWWPAQLVAGWQQPSEGSNTDYGKYAAAGAPELLRRQIDAHGVSCAWVCYGRSGGVIANITGSGGQVAEMRALIAETGGWEAFWFYLGGTDAINGTTKASFKTGLTSLMSDLAARNAYTGPVPKLFMLSGTRTSETMEQMLPLRQAVAEVAAEQGGTWFEPRDYATVDAVHPSQPGNVRLAASVHRALSGNWVQPTIQSASISGAVITLTMSAAMAVSGTPVGRVGVFDKGATTGAKTVSSVTASGNTLTITLASVPTADVDVYLYPHPDANSTAFLAQFIGDIYTTDGFAQGRPALESLTPTTVHVATVTDLAATFGAGQITVTSLGTVTDPTVTFGAAQINVTA